MSIICKISDGGATCPRGLNICCGICEHLPTCETACDPNVVAEFRDCPDVEIITDELTQFQSAVPDTIQLITTLIQQKKELEDREKQLKQKLVEAMETYGVKSFENENIKMTYVAPGTKTTIDGARLRKDHPDIATEYSKTSAVSAYVKVTVK